MKKSEALRILGLEDGATDDEVKAAHRKKVIENHPDKFAQDSTEYAKAEERTKRINEARDVLISRKWEPEFGRGYAGNPYSGPYNPYGGGSPFSGGSPFGGQGSGGNPFEGWPFGQGQQGPWTWTSWGGTQGQDGAPKNPFNPFAAQQEKPPEQRKAEAKKDLQTEIGVFCVKIIVLAGLSFAHLFPIGLFIYVVATILFQLWKRFRGCLLPILIPLAVVLVPLLRIILPSAGMLTIPLIGASVIALIFDVRSLYKSVKSYRDIKIKP